MTRNGKTSLIAVVHFESGYIVVNVTEQKILRTLIGQKIAWFTKSSKFYLTLFSVIREASNLRSRMSASNFCFNLYWNFLFWNFIFEALHVSKINVIFINMCFYYGRLRSRT